MTMRCLHGMETETCGHCNGLMEQRSIEKKQRTQDSEEILLLKEKYEEIKARLKNHWEDWTEEEYIILYGNFKGIASIRSKEFRKTVFKVAIELERTRLSIVWHYKSMFRGNYEKGGKVLVEFMDKLTKGGVR
jgi:flagellar motility protein MotE (MotC chaperone)